MVNVDNDHLLVFYYRYRHQKQWRRGESPYGPRWESVRYWLEHRAGLLGVSPAKGALVSYIQGCRRSSGDTVKHHPLADDDPIGHGDTLVLTIRPVVWRARVHRPFVPVAHRHAHALAVARGRRRDTIGNARAHALNDARSITVDDDHERRADRRVSWTSLSESSRIEVVARGDVVAPSPERTRLALGEKDAREHHDDPPDLHPSNLDENRRGHAALCVWVGEGEASRRRAEEQQQRQQQHRAIRMERSLALPDPLGPVRPDQMCLCCGDFGRHRAARCPRACEPGYRPLSDRRMPAGQPRDAYRRALEWERDIALVQFPRRTDPFGVLQFFMPRSVKPAIRPDGWSPLSQGQQQHHEPTRPRQQRGSPFVK